MTAATWEALLADVLARIVRTTEALEDGDLPLAHAVLVDLEADVVSSLAALTGSWERA